MRKTTNENFPEHYDMDYDTLRGKDNLYVADNSGKYYGISKESIKASSLPVLKTDIFTAYNSNHTHSE